MDSIWFSEVTICMTSTNHLTFQDFTFLISKIDNDTYFVEMRCPFRIRSGVCKLPST